MNKKEFRKYLSKNGHPCAVNTWFLGCVTINFLITIFIIVYLNILGKVPLKSYFVIYLLALIIVAIPTIVIDQLNDKEIRKCYKEYNKSKKLASAKDYTSILNVILFLSTFLLLVSTYTVCVRYVFNEEYYTRSSKITLGNKEIINTYNKKINEKLVIYLPEDLEKVRNDSIAEIDDFRYGEVFANDDIKLGIYFTDMPLKESNIKNYIIAVAYELEKEDYEDINLDKENNTVSYHKDGKLYYHSYFSYNKKLVETIFVCDIEDEGTWLKGFDSIRKTINFKR